MQVALLPKAVEAETVGNSYPRPATAVLSFAARLDCEESHRQFVDEVKPAPGWVEIGRGASCVVYRGWDHEFNKEFAFKVFSPQAIAVDDATYEAMTLRFEDEARILARLNHPGIVRIYKTLRYEGRPTLQTDYLPGGDLAANAASLVHRGPYAIAKFLEHTSRAVGYAHSLGIIHRDLKPGNILFCADGSPCVSDFGIAKLLEAPERASSSSDLTTTNRTAHGAQPGTRRYMAPEQHEPASNPASATTDVYALGLILTELLFQSPRAPLWTRRGRLLRRLDRIARTATSPNPAQRPSTGEHLARQLTAATRPTAWLWWVTGVLFVALLIVAVWPRRATPQIEVIREPATLSTAQTTELLNGEPIHLVENGQLFITPTIPLGGGSFQRVERKDGKLAIRCNNSTGALFELVRELPVDSVVIDAELEHLAGNRISWAGLYGAGGSARLGEYRSIYVAMARYNDGESLEDEDLPTQIGSRRIHLVPFDAKTQGKQSETQYTPFPPPKGKTIQATKPGRRHLRLAMDSTGITAFQVSNTGPTEVGSCNWAKFLAVAPDGFKPLAGTPIVPHGNGAVGIYVHRGEVVIHSVVVQKLNP